MSVSRRRIEALRALAERPGTEAEGALAREKLARAESAYRVKPSAEKVLEHVISIWTNPVTHCECGERHPRAEECPNRADHDRIADEISARFPKGTRAYYNRWAYERNTPCTVTGAAKQWNWLRVKFDHLKTPRSIPVYSYMGWHLRTEPIDEFESVPLRGC